MTKPETTGVIWLTAAVGGELADVDETSRLADLVVGDRFEIDVGRAHAQEVTDAVVRAIEALVDIGAVAIAHRQKGGQRLTNACHTSSSPPGRIEPSLVPTVADGCADAAIPNRQTGCGRRDRAGSVAESGHDPEHPANTITSFVDARAQRMARQPAVEEQIAAACGIHDWRACVEQFQQARRDVGASATRWTGPCLTPVLQLALRGRKWPADQTAAAPRRGAVDPESRSPMRVAEAGASWGEVHSRDEGSDLKDAKLPTMELALLEAGGVRVKIRMRARRALEEAGIPVTRTAVIRGADRLLLDGETVADGSTGGAA